MRLRMWYHMLFESPHNLRQRERKNVIDNLQTPLLSYQKKKKDHVIHIGAHVITSSE